MQTRWLTALAATIALAFGGGSAASAAAATPLALSACGSGEPGQCGTLRVPLDRGGATPGDVDLRVRVLPARSGAPVATVVGLAGGPGQAATPLLEQFADSFGAAARTRRFVTFDQRGTGASGRLRCRALTVPASSLSAAVGACADELGPGRAHYTTAASVADLEAVRAALGVERIVLFATSYGTKVALDYAAAYPAARRARWCSTRSCCPSGVDPFQRTTLGSIGRVLRDVCADRGCSFTRDPLADVAALVRRMARAPLRGPFVTADGTHAQRVDRACPAARPAARRRLRSPYVRAADPGRGGVRAARRQRGAAAATGRCQRRRGTRNGASDALYLATTLRGRRRPVAARHAAVAAPRARSTRPLAALPQRTFAPFDRRDRARDRPRRHLPRLAGVAGRAAERAAAGRADADPVRRRRPAHAARRRARAGRAAAARERRERAATAAHSVLGSDPTTVRRAGGRRVPRRRHAARLPRGGSAASPPSRRGAGARAPRFRRRRGLPGRASAAPSARRC